MGCWCAIERMSMVGAMAKPVEQTPYDDLVVQAKTQAGALARLYELYYDRIYRFCVHRLYSKATAEDITSGVFLTVAAAIRQFKGRTEQDFRAWIFTIAANQANAYIRKTSRRKRLMENVVAMRRAAEPQENPWSAMDWPTLYTAILQLKPEHQTVLTLRFFENIDFDEIGRIMGAKPATIRVTLHRILRKLREILRDDFGEEEHDEGA
jgi:RNA polymerase sigma-70 factor (ECF subfamily)